MDARLPAFPLADADKCVKCALCLPHCPTYRVTLDEGESPRGRIALMQAMTTGALEITPRLTAHLDHCLACRACEAVCPAEVPYGKLIDAARAELSQRGHREPRAARLFAACMRSTRLRHVLHRGLRFAQVLGLLSLLRGLGITSLRRQLELLPAVGTPRRWRKKYAPRTQTVARVMLFTGCIADVTQPQVSVAAVAVLNALGLDVHIPPQQGCCGALDQHGGRHFAAAALAQANLSAFAGEAPVLGTASGCLATLKGYPEILEGNPDAADFARRVQDVSAFLLAHPKLKEVAFRPWQTRVVVQSPCTLRNVLKTDQAVPELLHHVPQIEVEALPGALGCCGAAGSYMLTQAEQADAFAETHVHAIRERHAEALVTSNVGCALHLTAALRRRGVEIPVLHPVEVLARQLPESWNPPGI